MSEKRNAHPAAAMPEAARIGYAQAIASIVRADGKAHPSEQAKVVRLCDALGLSEAGRAEVKGAIRAPNFAEIEAWLRRFVLDEALRYRLMWDALVMAFADGELASGERSELAAFAEVLGFTTDQVLAMALYVERTLGHKKKRGEPSLAEALMPGLDGLPVDPASATEAIRWLHDAIGSRGA